MRILTIFCLLLILPQFTLAADGLGVQSLTNELSFFKNYDDYQAGVGYTIQFVSLQLVSLGSFDARLDLAIDYNFQDNVDDNYWEFGIGVPVWKGLALNYQRVEGTFVSSMNQFGVRWEF